MNPTTKITQLNPTTFEFQNYIESDERLISSFNLDTSFISSTDYIEFYIYDENQNLIFPSTTTILTSFNIKGGDILLNPIEDLKSYNFDLGTYNIFYNFYRNVANSNLNNKFFIKEISSDRTEVRLDINIEDKESLISSSLDFIEYRDKSLYFVDFYLNFGNNKTIISNNLKVDDNDTLLIKLYEPLPSEFDIKSELWIIEIISEPQLYSVSFIEEEIIIQDFEYISGPNFNLNIKKEKGSSDIEYCYQDLVDTSLTSSLNQLQSLLNKKEINININYENFSEFINFSSAKTRLENFYFKVKLIEDINIELGNTLDNITGDTTNTLPYISSKTILTSQIDNIIKNFDGYEYFLYYDSGSNYSWPKSSSKVPYVLYPTGSSEVINWVDNITLTASLYDENNNDWLYFTIPEYLKEDSENRQYELFMDMVGQHFDNIWVYTKDITNKFNNDNRLEYGISKDLVSDAIKEFGIKLYSNKFNVDDLYNAFLGFTSTFDTFPVNNISSTIPVNNGFEYIDTRVSASNDIIPLDDANKRLYKRIYHNIPYLLKTKGTKAGLRALITSYGIPNTVLRINEFGGKDKNNTQAWDLEQDVFNYAFDTGEDANNFISSSWDSNPKFPSGDSSPASVQFRFKSPSIPSPTNNIASTSIRYSQSLFSTDDGGNVVLEYTGYGFVSGSYSGSVASPYDTYGRLKFIPAADDDPSLSASVYLPFFNEDWWAVQINVNSNTASLYVANEIDGKVGFNESSSNTGFDGSFWGDASIGYLNKGVDVTPSGLGVYQPFSGSFQELRYWTQSPSQNNFYDYTVNPYSTEGNGINGTPDQLYFRAALGTQLDTGSRTSIHPRVTGSASQITSSFDVGSEFFISGEKWVTNVENIFQDQVPAGIKNRVTDKIQIKNSNQPSDNQLSPFISLEQTSVNSGSYGPDINYLEVVFSPQDEINDDINAQLGYFNIGEYIGDPRQISSSDRSYTDLDILRDSYFNKYIKSYDVRDFIRLMKFFDNSLFNMIKDFIPARMSLSSGVVVKQHILERNRQRPAQISTEDQQYLGTIKPQSRNYNTGSGDTGQYEYNSGSSIYRFKGGTGGTFEIFNGLYTSPSASAYGLTNRFEITQSWFETKKGKLGQETVEVWDQAEFYDGVFSGSCIIATQQDLNPDCNPYIQVIDTPLNFNPIFFNVDIGSHIGGTVNSSDFSNPKNSPINGYAWFLTLFNADLNEYEVTHIKLSNVDINGNQISDFITYDLNFITFTFPEGSKKYFINGFQVNSSNILLTIDQSQGDYSTEDLTENKGSENWSLYVDGNFSSSQDTDNQSQGELKRATPIQLQYFQYWNGTLNDDQNFMDTGSVNFTSSNLFTNDNFDKGTYNPQRTSNIPWIISASIYYSASDNGATGSFFNTLGIYHSGSSTAKTINFTEGQTSSFNPGTKIVDLEENYFSVSEWDSNLEGNIWSYDNAGATSSGHPMILSSGSASFDFHFDDLNIGTVTDMGADKSFYYPFSGSGWNLLNLDFEGYESGGGEPGGNGVFNKEHEDGRWEFDADSFLETNSVTSLQLKFYLDIDGEGGKRLGLTYSRTTSSLSGGWTPIESNPIVAGQAAFYYILNKAWFVSRLGNDSRPFYFRMEVQTDTDFEYIIDNWQCAYEYNDESGNNSGDSFIQSQGTLLQPALMNLNLTSGNNEGTADIRVILKNTSSAGDYEITSSDTLSSQIISSSGYYNFTDSPISGTTPHSNLTESMYYVQYEFTNITSSIKVGFQKDNDYPKLYITQSIKVGTEETFRLTGSLRVYQGNKNDSNIEEGDIILSEDFIVPDSSSKDRVTISGSFQGNFDYDDAFRMAIHVNKSLNGGLTISEYTMSIHPNDSVLSPLDEPYEYGNFNEPTSSAVILPTFFGSGVLPFNLALDCQPLLNNYVNSRDNTWLMEVDYTTDIYNPINSASIFEGTATPAKVPDSNYSSLSIITSRYIGSKSTSERLNVWTPKDTGTYGKLPTIELRTAFFGYFDSIRDVYPNLNDTVNINLTYLIDEEGNAIPPSLQGTGLTTLIQSFPEGGLASISINSGSKELKELNSLYPTHLVGKLITPILYTQTSSIGYSRDIPLTGSGRISLYDNDDENAFDDYSFSALGSSSLDGLPSKTIYKVLDPTEEIEVKSYATNPYSLGIITFPGGDPGIGDNLGDTQHIFLETSFTTNWLYNSNGAELNVKLSLLSGSNNIPFELEDIFLIVHKKGGKSFNVGSVIGKNNDIVRFIKINSVNKFTHFNKRLSKNSTHAIGLNSSSQIEIVLLNRAIKTFLKQKGLYKSGDGGIEDKGDIVALEWGIKANSGNYIFNRNDIIKWEINGEINKSKGKIQSVFYPEGYEGKKLPTKITNFGSKSHLLSGDNTGSAPFWVFTGSAGGGNDILDQRILIMSSSNINEAYGGSHYQGELNYEVGPSEYHPGGEEPEGTRFDTIIYPINFEEGDEIRFGNNENYTYKIKKITPPQQNIESDGKGRLKIELDKEVPTSINKDFFLVRRYIDNANSILLGLTYPYSNPPKESSTSGLLFPEFPVISLQENASEIITNLIGKGVIK